MRVPFSLHVSCYCKNIYDRGASSFGLEGVYNLMGVLSMFFFFFYGSTHCPTTIVCYNSNHNFSTYLSIRKCNLQVRVQVTFLTKKKVMSTPNVNN